MLYLRLLTAAGGLPILVGTAWWGGVSFAAVVTILAVAAAEEWTALLRSSLPGLDPWPGRLAAAGLPSLVAWAGPAALLPALVGFAFVAAAWPLVRPVQTARDRFWAGLAGVSGVVYVPSLFSFLLLLRAEPGGFWYVLFVLVTVWGSDIGAYCTGSLLGLGRRRLSRDISPGKSWEGFFGGWAAGIGLAALFSYVIGVPASPLRAAGLAFALVPVGVLGDLFESAAKRAVGAKDSGTGLPGHGGVLDRFDSLLWVLPAAYYLLRVAA